MFFSRLYFVSLARRVCSTHCLAVLLIAGGIHMSGAEPTSGQPPAELAIGNVFEYMQARAGPNADKSHRLHLPMRVNFYDTYWRNLWVQDERSPGYIPLGKTLPPILAGQRVLLEGSTIPAQGLTAETIKITVLDENDRTPPESASGQIGNMEGLNQRRIQLEGFIDTLGEIPPGHARYVLLSEDRELIGWILTRPGEVVPKLTNHFVRVTGVYSSRTDPSGTMPEIEIWSASLADIQVLHSIYDDPSFEIQTTPLNQLLRTKLREKVKVHGRVQSQQPGRSIVIRDGTGQVTVETLQQQRFEPGSEVEAVGTFVVTLGASTVTSALVRKVSTRPETTQPSRAEGSVIQMAEDLRKLSSEEAAKHRRVDISGVVTWVLPDQEYLFVQDVSGGVRVHFKPGSFNLPVIQNSVRIEGTTFDYGPSAAIELEKLTQLAAMRLPLQRVATLDQALTGSEDAQYVEMRGYLRHSEVSDKRTYLDITTPTGEFHAVIQTPESLKSAENSLIRIRGVCDNHLDENHRINGMTLWVPYLHSIRIEEPAPPNVYDSPLRSIRSLRQLSAIPGITRTRIEGQVLAQRAGRYLVVQQEDAGMLVLSSSLEKVTPGDLVQAVGLLGREGERTLLRDAVYRRTGHAELPAPLAIGDPSKPTSILDGRLIRVRGGLINQLRRPDLTRLTLQSGNTIFEAWLDQTAAAQRLTEFPLETQLEVVGVYRTVVDDSRQTRGFHVELRGPEDVVVSKKARFWTFERLIGVAAILGGCTVLGFAWVSALRRRVRKQLEQIRGQLAKEMVLEERHRGILENASDFIFTTDLQGRFTSFNAAGERMTGYPREKALSLNIRDLLVPERDREAWLKPEVVLAGDGTATFQSQLRAIDDRVIWIETSARLIHEAGRPVGVLGIVRDISERKQVEEELKRARDAAEANTRAKSEFLANMSHEIRTPMNAVIGMSNLLLDTRLDERQRDFAETIRNGAEALLTVLNDILDFSKMEAGRLQIESVDFDLRDTVDGTVELLAAGAASKGLGLTAFVPADLPASLRGDPSRLRQVLLNMLGNALKFTERGEVILQISVESETAQDARLLFEVIDTGVGLSPEEQERLFRPFSQADSSTTRRFGGTGLGLAISKQIIDLLDGRCGVRSKLGEGSTFWFTARFAKTTTVEKANVAQPTLSEVKFLIVDDSSTSRRLIGHYASAWGMRPSGADHGCEALDLLKRAAATADPFSLVIVDTTLGDMSGIELIRQIRGVATLSTMPVVMLNSLNSSLPSGELEELKVSSLILKPIRQSELASALTRACALPSEREAAWLSASEAPVKEAPAGKEGSVETFLSSSVPTTALRVLLAEDNLVNQRVALFQLQKLGHTASAVTTGIEAIRAVEQADYDVILMDCHMPEMDGFEATRRIRAKVTGSKPRIIALTANAMQGDKEKCLAAGMDDYLSKPVRISELRAALLRVQPTQANGL